MNALDLFPELWHIIWTGLKMRDRHWLARSCKLLLRVDGGLATRLPDAWYKQLRWDVAYTSIYIPRRNLLWAMHGEGVTTWPCFETLRPDYGLSEKNMTTTIGMVSYENDRTPRAIYFYATWEVEYFQYQYIATKHLRTYLFVRELPVPLTISPGSWMDVEIDFPPRNDNDDDQWVIDLLAKRR
jgi:hypothetical protein